MNHKLFLQTCLELSTEKLKALSVCLSVFYSTKRHPSGLWNIHLAVHTSDSLINFACLSYVSHVSFLNILYPVFNFNSKVDSLTAKPPRPKMSKVAHSAIIIQRAFRIFKKKQKEGRLRNAKGSKFQQAGLTRQPINNSKKVSLSVTLETKVSIFIFYRRLAGGTLLRWSDLQLSFREHSGNIKRKKLPEQKKLKCQTSVTQRP